ncbi:MAG TPA: hypothetical protein VFJ25_12355, partial [Casimicrobiaceae bacterium]|nr:hypothetical protein [Casimicrobiaceae bacterium]
MAGALGQLVVELQANTVQFNDALTKSAYQAAQHVQSIRTSMAGLESSVGSMVSTFSAFGSAVAGAFVVREVYDWAAAVVSAGEGLANLSNVTGSSVETLSRLQNIALVSGESFDDFRTVMGRLSVGLAAADSGSNKAGQALQFLGVTARDPAQALIEVAQDMNQYADGAGKAALARDLFGRGGEQFLATLHSIAQEQGIVNTFTTQSAEEAQRLAESMRTLTVESSAVKDAFLTSVVPALADVIQQYELARNAGLDFWSSLQTAGLDNNLAQLVPSIDAVKAALDDSQKHIDTMREHQATYGEQSHALWQRDQEDILKTQQVIDDLTKKYQVMIEIRDKAILSRPGLSGPSTFDARDYQAQFKP